MAIKTRIFIGSAAQPELKELREQTFRVLEELGHRPFMYERNFGPWPNYEADAIEHCLEMVRNSDVFVLFISNHSGTYVESDQRSVTHLEFSEAYRHGKLILPFVDRKISDAYFQGMSQILSGIIGEYSADHGHEPDMKTLLSLMKGMEPGHVDPQVWIFLQDIVKKGIYFEPLSLGVDITAKIKEYLSDLLYKGAALIPKQKLIRENVQRVLIYEDFEDLVQVVTENACITKIYDWRIFLTTLRSKLKGGPIDVNGGKYSLTRIGEIRDCSAITLYKRNGNVMELIEKDGRAGGETSYRLDDGNCFVSCTYNNTATGKHLAFREDKNMIYMTERVGEFVICLHFPCDRSWNAQRVRDYQKDITDGILKTQGNALYFNLAKLVLGGMNN